jgi:hypothetical protein
LGKWLPSDVHNAGFALTTRPQSFSAWRIWWCETAIARISSQQKSMFSNVNMLMAVAMASSVQQIILAQI